MPCFQSAKAMIAFFILSMWMACCVPAASNSVKLRCLNKTTTNAEGIFEFPRTKERCKKIIRYPKDSEIELTLLNVVKCYPSSDYGQRSEDYVEILGNAGNVLAKYCIRRGKGGSKRERFKSNMISIIYKGTSSNELQTETRNHVIVHYKRTKPCRLTLRDEKGTVQSSSYHNYTNLPIECEWSVNTEPGKVISLSFQEIELSMDCDAKFIEVRDGKDDRAPLLMKICDKFPHKSIRSKTPNLWIRMISTSRPGVRFKAAYETIINCNPEHVNRRKSTLIPPKNVFCKTWIVTADPGQITALSLFAMNLKSTSRTSCSGNVVEVLDGDTKDAPVIGRYCNLNFPPSVIASKGDTLTVTYKSTTNHDSTNRFFASFTSVSPSHYKASCFVQNKALHFRCGDDRQIPCDWQCDGAIQCRDNSDENSCPQMKPAWQKLQLFVIVMGTICATTLILCVGIICFRKFIIDSNHPSDSYGRRWSSTDQAPITPTDELPSPPPCYFNGSDNAAPSIIRGTYFFGNEFSQSGIHNSSLFGIPPPIYHSTESLHWLSDDNNGVSNQQYEVSNIPLVQTNVLGDESQSREEQYVSNNPLVNEINSPPVTDICSAGCCNLPEDKDNHKLTSSVVENRETCEPCNETTDTATICSSQTENSIVSCSTNDVSGTDIGITNTFGAMQV